MIRILSKAGRSSNKRTGFTLIELLVVVSVIAVLLAILLPSLGKARALAKRVGCGSNLKQLALAWTAYLDDHDGRFYQGGAANFDYGGWKGTKGWWPRPLNKYVGLGDPNEVTEDDAKVFCCPADRGGIPGALFREKAYRAHGTSYQTNIFLIGQNACGAFSDNTAALDQEISQRLPNVNRSKVSNPSRLLLMGDFGWINQWKPRPHPEEEWKDLAEWHGKVDCHNMAFLDGHVKFVNIRKGYYVTSEYLVLPFEDLRDLALKVQGPSQ
jgi:prepilin-type N-terminal cleavage/methylation domain-containing protein/prepilin-type processing-associated H-X9-DG protein